MQTNIFQKAQQPLMLSIKSNTGLVTQVRNHVKMYPWRVNKNYKECYLDNSKTPYTDKNNMNEFFAERKQKKEWQKVIYKNKDNRFNSFKVNDSYKSDPVEARETARSRLLRFQNSLRDRGSARESVPYNPPEGVEERILTLYKATQLQAQTGNSETSLSDADILATSLNSNRALKFNLITRCIEEFAHDVPNSHLTDIESIRDLVEYFTTPVRGVNPYSALLRQEESLPVNLNLISEPLRFNREKDTFFGGYNALPGIVSKIPGLRGSKKYPILNQDEFQWPDI